MASQYKNERYKGYSVRFIRLNKGKYGVAAQPVRYGWKQYLGMGRTKAEAFEDYKNSVDRIDLEGNWKDDFKDWRSNPNG